MKKLEFLAVADDLEPETWRVEATDNEGEGFGYVSLFLGRGAEQRAREYAAFKNGQAHQIEVPMLTAEPVAT